MANGARTHLTLYLTGSYLLLIIYASLYPLTGWHDSGNNPLGFLGAAWPRYYTTFDLATNLIAYLPFGFLCAAAWRRRLAPLPAWLLATALGGALSLTMELLQNYLPNRVPSNLDLACNAGGTLLGGWLGALWGARVLDEGKLADLRRRLMMHGHGGDIGILLVAAWLMTQLSPEALLFGSGNLRQMLDLPPVQPFLAERFVDLETFIAAAGLLAAGLIISMLLRRHARGLTLGLLAGALLIKTAAHALLMGPAAALGWITPGNSLGIGIGLALWWCASFLGFPLQRAVAALALLLATVMVNVAPENPYLHNTLQVWNPGQFLNFNGLTRLISSLWPFLALPWLMIYRPRKHEPDY
ncbi:MAG: VanZ family protein [Betaproteobacteria bacterium]|nr:VanZ family protein [Betaproteobacteria bacterium]